jgi:hypothetical protein
MNYRFTRMALHVGLGLAALFSGGVALAQSDAILSQQRASVVSDRAQLSAVSHASPRAGLAQLLNRRGVDRETMDSIVETSRYTDKSGRAFGRFEQRIDGLRVHGAYAKVAQDRQGVLLQVIERFAPVGGGITRPTIGDGDALGVAVALNFGMSVGRPEFVRRDGAASTFAKTDFFYSAPTVERVLIARGPGALEEGFLVENWSQEGNLLYHTLVDGRGRVVENELRTAEDSYNVFPDHPGNSNQTVTAGPGGGNIESPSGWLAGAQTTVSIQGNNVHAYLDRDNNGAPDGGGTTVSDGNFLTSANLSQTPTTAQNQAVAVQNLFYLNNVIHDTLYGHGFTEATGNFQNNNFGNGGRGNDAVNAEAQDGGGTNNANFSTPNDGSPGRMQMYLWTYTNPNRDGDLDSDIVWHEYGHGLTWRMIGSMSGSISGAIGEGMSDVLAILRNNEDRVGEYSTNDPDGIRSAPYTNYGRTLGDFTGQSVHFDGEIYAATIWYLKGLYENDGLSADNLLGDLVGGMNFTPSGPTYPDMRDGILAHVDTVEGDCRVWEAFAAFGIGEGSSIRVKGGGPFGGGRVTVTESFAVPSACSGSPPPPPPPSGDATLTAFSGSSALQGKKRWRATVTASVDVEGAIVDIDWTDGSSTSCTVSGGSCTSSISLRNNTDNVTATVVSINGASVQAATGVSPSVVIARP